MKAKQANGQQLLDNDTFIGSMASYPDFKDVYAFGKSGKLQ
jgi:hypothetical protein